MEQRIRVIVFNPPTVRSGIEDRGATLVGDSVDAKGIELASITHQHLLRAKAVLGDHHGEVEHVISKVWPPLI